jgi:D-3-phosphoglycerate dehydrogenase / 2-oxoglutarate reductase
MKQIKQTIVILEGKDYSPKALSILSNLSEIEFFDPVSSTKKYTRATILITRLAYHLNNIFLGRFPNVEIIVSPTTGLNHVDLDFCNNKGIKVISLKGETDFLKSITATAELTFGLILNLVRNVAESTQSVINGHWDRDSFRGRELSSLTLGILGFGRLGWQVANYAKSFGMEVLASDPYTDLSVFDEFQIENCSKEELFCRSDIISLHVDYNQANHHLVTAEDFLIMKPGSYFINTSRGELVDEDALLRSLSNGHLAGAALDVLENEQSFPDLFEKPLVKYAKAHGNLLITPHIGGCTLDSMHNTELFIVKKLKQFLETPK